MSKSHWTRRDFLKAVGLGAVSFAVPGCTGLSSGLSNKSPARKPNIVFIMADDVGEPVLGCYGGSSYQTPNLDRLAATGTRFNHCYSSPVCAPSRVKIMTGRYGFRNYKEWGHIPPEEITFGHVLKDAGYATALAGKWQMCLQKNDPNHITKMGFEQNCVFGWHEGPRYHGPLIYENGKLRREPEDKYGPDIFCQFIIDFIRRNKDKPFLAYYSTTLAHEISNDLKVPPPVGPNGRYQTYKELVEYMDKLIGRIVSTLDELGLRENTLILFTGDNGTPPKFITKAVNGKYISEPVVSKVGDKVVIGGKGKLTDAGTKVPLIANWPGTTPAGRVSDDLIDFSDFMPTFAELGGSAPPRDRPIDGASFAPQLMGKRGNPREWAYCQWNGKAWARTQRWKLYRDGRLYDMEKDPLEESPVPSERDTAETSAVRKKLAAVLDNLNKV
ncbi:MAG TPA: sulfatase-like hydrolase/transferase [Sedimentisphaerales bacterium]|nr:sulfatase-like hydrolase/transferase [Sedimentisphaerales bacterium]